jgi:hypothetical protein
MMWLCEQILAGAEPGLIWTDEMWGIAWLWAWAFVNFGVVKHTNRDTGPWYPSIFIIIIFLQPALSTAVRGYRPLGAANSPPREAADDVVYLT